MLWESNIWYTFSRLFSETVYLENPWWNSHNRQFSLWFFTKCILAVCSYFSSDHIHRIKTDVSSNNLIKYLKNIEYRNYKKYIGANMILNYFLWWYITKYKRIRYHIEYPFWHALNSTYFSKHKYTNTLIHPWTYVLCSTFNKAIIFLNII